MKVDVSVDCPGWDAALPEARDIVCRALRAASSVAAASLPPASEVSVVLGDDDLLRQLNRDWRQRDRSTNVLAFPLHAPDAVAAGSHHTPAERSLGDIVVAYGVVRSEAARDGKALGDHLAHMIVHGFLHLLGFDHLDDGQAGKMEALERRALADLGIADPYVTVLPGPRRTLESQ